jgi:hypothetical protein
VTSEEIVFTSISMPRHPNPTYEFNAELAKNLRSARFWSLLQTGGGNSLRLNVGHMEQTELWNFWVSGLYPLSGVSKNTRLFGNWICFRPQV